MTDDTDEQTQARRDRMAAVRARRKPKQVQAKGPVSAPSPSAHEVGDPPPVPAPVADLPVSRGLTEDRKARLREKARLQVEREAQQKAADDYLAAEVAKLRREAGLDKQVLGGVLDELVDIVIDLPYEGSPFIQLDMPNGLKYEHGRTYRIPRHIYNTLREIIQRNADLQAQCEGKSAIRQRQRNIKVMGDGTIIGADGLVAA